MGEMFPQDLTDEAEELSVSEMFPQDLAEGLVGISIYQSESYRDKSKFPYQGEWVGFNNDNAVSKYA